MSLICSQQCEQVLLDVDILGLIFAHAAAMDIVKSFSLVCRTWFEASESKLLWTRLLGFSTADCVMVDIPTPKHEYFARLQQKWSKIAHSVFMQGKSLEVWYRFDHPRKASKIHPTYITVVRSENRLRDVDMCAIKVMRRDF